MDIKELKNYLYENPLKLQSILNELGFHHVKLHSGSGDSYFTMGNVDGDNQQAITVYLTPSLLTINYTRDMSVNKNNCDVIDLVCFVREENLFDNLKWLAEKSGISYYENFKVSMPESLRIIKKLKEMLNKLDESEEDSTPIKIKDEKIISYYFPYANELFESDGIPINIQRQFEVGLDAFTGRITIPVRDEIGNLVGVKGRYFERDVPENEKKYYYLEAFPRGKILYGYYFSKDYIKNSDHIIIGESEKSYMQLWTMNYKNSVATGGTKLARPQIDKLSRLGKKLILSFDKDFTEDMIQNLRNKFLGHIDFHAIIDKDNILANKESPTDNPEKFKTLIGNNVYKIEKTEE